MKRIAFALAAALLTATAAGAAERRARIEIRELYCPSCPYIVARAVKSVESVRIVSGDYDEKAQKIVFLVAYDDTATDPQTIAEAPAAFGYPGRVLEAAPPGS